MPIYAVAQKYHILRGVVQNLAQNCHGFAAGMIKLCERMRWGALAVVLDHFSDRLRAGMYIGAAKILKHLNVGSWLTFTAKGAKADLLALSQISFIKSRTARVFWENGFKTVGALAIADVNAILPILLMVRLRLYCCRM